MKIWFPLIAVCILSTTAWAQDVITIAYFQAQPHIIYEGSSQKISGTLYTFLTKHIAPEMGVRFDWKKSPSSLTRIQRMLENDKISATAFLVATPERRKRFSYTDKPFFAAKPVIGVLNENPLKIVKRIEDIQDLRIGYVSNNYISPFMRDKRIQFKFVFTGIPNVQNLKKLITGRIDAVYIPDKAGLLLELKNLNMTNQVRVIELPDRPSLFHVVFSRQNKLLAARFNTAFDKIEGNRLYQEIINQYYTDSLSPDYAEQQMAPQ